MIKSNRVHKIGEPDHIGVVVKVRTDRTVDVEWDGHPNSMKNEQVVDLIRVGGKRKGVLRTPRNSVLANPTRTPRTT